MIKERAIPQFLIGAPSSESGKTTVSRGIMALLTRKGKRVQPFKCGPDYIDTKFHSAVCGRPSVNLDTFMASAPHVSELYARYAADADACVVEGMMGLFDGYDRDRGSSAEVAEVLHLPVILVVDAKATAYSMAPLLYGFVHFRPEVRIAGVIFNRVGSPKHYDMLREVCEELGIVSLGYLPKDETLVQESRYLGLDFSRAEAKETLDRLVDLLEAHIDWERLMELTTLSLPSPKVQATDREPGNLRIAVARNAESFSFIYEEHLAILRRLGTVTFFDPEQEAPCFKRIDLLYLPGGYPEKHRDALAANHRLLRAIRVYAESGGRILAECGGMIYLSAGVTFGDRIQLLARVLPFAVSIDERERRLSLGYRQFEWGGQSLRGHEFHYTQIGEVYAEWPSAAQVLNAKGQPVPTPIFRYKNVIASYTHLYWGEIDLLKLF